MPYRHLIAESQHLGYRKSAETRSTWIARYFIQEGDKRRYRFETIGSADDTSPRNGTQIFSFSQAIEKAQESFKTRARTQAAGVTIGPYTVSDAATEWLSSGAGSEASKVNSASNLRHHILPILGHVEVAKLTRQQIQDWLKQMGKKPLVRVQLREASQKRLPPSRQSKITYDAADPETRRKRQDTANRVFNDLRALLTLSYSNQHVSTKAAWETAKRFEDVDRAKNEYLTLPEAKTFLKVCPQDFKDLVQGALITGCRYGELASLTVKAYDVQLSAISLVQKKTGKLKHVFLTDEEAEFFDLRCAGKQGDELMFRRSDGIGWQKSNQQPRMKAVLKAAGISRHVRFHDLRHTFATLLAMNGTSILLIANQLGHSGTRMAEKHYAHFSPAYVAATIRANKPSFGILINNEDTND